MTFYYLRIPLLIFIENCHLKTKYFPRFLLSNIFDTGDANAKIMCSEAMDIFILFVPL